jgi:hypothetical protein
LSIDFDKVNRLLSTLNVAEAVLWFVLAAVIAWRSLRSERRVRTCARIAALTFVAFAVSDLIESKTGAWYRPLWLLVWKAACIVILASCYRYYRQIRR